MVDQFLRIDEVKRATGLGHAKIYAMMAEGKFPRQVKILNSKSVAWLGSEIEAWQQAQVAARDAQLKQTPTQAA
jgi:prophage regulatory protein